MGVSHIHWLIKYFQQYLELLPVEIDYLEKHIPIQRLNADTILLKEGEISTSFFFVLKGMLRMYYVVDGVEKTTFFYGENTFVSSYESFTKQVPSKHYFQTLVPSHILVFHEKMVAELLLKFPRFEVLARIAMEAELSVYQEMIASFVTLNAEKRYLKLLEEQPSLLQKIPQYHIATYLGVSPETLSRIRQRVSKKQTS